MHPMDLPAIDVHGHFGSHADGADRFLDRLMSADVDAVRERARAVGIVVTIVSPLRALTPYGGDVRRANEEAAAAAERCADIRFWAVLDPRLPESFRQVDALLDHPGCAGIKIHPIRHFYEIRAHGDAIFEFAAARSAVVITHSGDQGSFPEDFVPFADRYPAVRLILGHLGNSADGAVTRQVAAIKRAEAGNVYVDTSSAKSIYPGLIEWAVAEVGTDRLLFGTDTPVYSAAAQKARVAYAEIDEATKRAILFENATRLLGIAAG